MRHSFTNELERHSGYEPPSAEQLILAQHMPVGHGDPSAEYYLYVALTAAPDTDRRTHLETLQGLQTAVLASREQWVPRGRFPVALGDGESTQLRRDLVAGRIRCLVWGAPGCGWQVGEPADDAATAADGSNLGGSSPGGSSALGGGSLSGVTLEGLEQLLCELLQPPKVLFVVMPFGARRAAARPTLLSTGAELDSMVKLFYFFLPPE